MTYASSTGDFCFPDPPPRLPARKLFCDLGAPPFRIHVLEVRVDLTDSRFHFESAFRRGGYFGVSRVSRVYNYTKYFQKVKTRRENQKRKMFDCRAFILFRTQSPHAQ